MAKMQILFMNNSCFSLSLTCEVDLLESLLQHPRYFAMKHWMLFLLGNLILVAKKHEFVDVGFLLFLVQEKWALVLSLLFRLVF